MWTDVPKPTGTTYTNINPLSKTEYDQSSVEYDQANIFYDGGDPALWSDITKPGAQVWTNISKPS